MTQNNRNNQSDSDRISWTIIIVSFILGLWPIGVILLFYKLFDPHKKTVKNQAPSLSEEERRRRAEEMNAKIEKLRAEKEAKENIKNIFKTPTDDKKTSKMLIGIGAGLFLLSLLFLLGVTESTGAWTILKIVATMFGSGMLFYNGISMSRAMERYTRYDAIIGANDAYEIESLAAKTGYSVKRVEKDIQRMIEKGFFGKTAYINKELGYFFKSSQADAELAEAKFNAFKKSEEAAKKEAAKQTASVYDQVLYQIRDVNDRIPDEVMTAKIKQIEDITAKIFTAVEKEPQKRSKIDKFMSYYLPTTLKLLEHYASIDKAGIDGENINKSKKSIENAMDSIVDGFKNQLDSLYKTDTMDIESDIDVMVKMMERDRNKTGQDFNLSEKNAWDKMQTSSGTGSGYTK